MSRTLNPPTTEDLRRQRKRVADAELEIDQAYQQYQQSPGYQLVPDTTEFRAWSNAKANYVVAKHDFRQSCEVFVNAILDADDITETASASPS